MRSNREQVKGAIADGELGLFCEWSVWRHRPDGTPEMIEGDLPEEIARQMVADYAAEGETVWMQRTAHAPE